MREDGQFQDSKPAPQTVHPPGVLSEKEKLVQEIKELVIKEIIVELKGNKQQ